jgi:hypothetical protein
MPSELERRWKINICPECGERIILAEDGHYHAAEPSRFIPAEKIEVVPLAALEAERGQRKAAEEGHDSWKAAAFKRGEELQAERQHREKVEGAIRAFRDNNFDNAFDREQKLFAALDAPRPECERCGGEELVTGETEPWWKRTPCPNCSPRPEEGNK